MPIAEKAAVMRSCPSSLRGDRIADRDHGQRAAEIGRDIGCIHDFGDVALGERPKQQCGKREIENEAAKDAHVRGGEDTEADGQVSDRDCDINRTGYGKDFKHGSTGFAAQGHGLSKGRSHARPSTPATDRRVAGGFGKCIRMSEFAVYAGLFAIAFVAATHPAGAIRARARGAAHGGFVPRLGAARGGQPRATRSAPRSTGSSAAPSKAMAGGAGFRQARSRSSGRRDGMRNGAAGACCLVGCRSAAMH